VESHNIQTVTPAWKFQAWASFVIAFLAMVIGIYNLPTDLWVKGFLGMGLLFVVGSSFTLAKTLRDDHEAQKLINRVVDAKTENLLHKYESKSDKDA
jgi:hypothetical protein